MGLNVLKKLSWTVSLIHKSKISNRNSAQSTRLGCVCRGFLLKFKQVFVPSSV